MTLSFAQYLLDAPEHNGHKQTEIKSMPFQDIRQLCLDLEDITGESFTFELWVEGCRKKDCGTIYRQRTTKENQMILGIDEVVY